MAAERNRVEKSSLSFSNSMGILKSSAGKILTGSWCIGTTLATNFLIETVLVTRVTLILPPSLFLYLSLIFHSLPNSFFLSFSPITLILSHFHSLSLIRSLPLSQSSFSFFLLALFLSFFLSSSMKERSKRTCSKYLFS